jgi:RHS repeat-associated protein
LRLIAKLQAVAVATGTGDFKNAVNTTTEYVYSTDGSLTKDDNKKIQSITYNMLGKAQVITYSGTPTKTVTYTYDAAGNKLKVATLANSVTTTTDYVGGFVYTNNALGFFSSPEGRVVKNGANYEYQYAIADHQGNTRVLFSSVAPTAQASTADMEAATNTGFLNYTANRVNFELFDHTDAGMDASDYAQKLTGASNAQVGLAKSFKVYAGDKVKVESWAKYWNAGSTASNLSGFALALTGAFGVSAASTGDALKAYNTLNNFGGLVTAGTGHSNVSTDPIVGVTILLFDKDFKFLDASWKQLNVNSVQTGATPKAPHEYLSSEYTVREAGYAYMYLSNESPTLVEAYFDDVVMTHTPGNIVQYNEYYPFGLQTANSWTRENTTSNNFLGNGGTELNTTSQLYDLDYRNYDPILGRMTQVDPMATKYASLTPYNYGFNDPVTFTDVSGADPIDVDGWIAEQRALETWFINTTPIDPGGGGWGNSSYYNSMMGGYGVAGAGMPNFSIPNYAAAASAYRTNMYHDAASMDKQSYGAKYGSSVAWWLVYGGAVSDEKPSMYLYFSHTFDNDFKGENQWYASVPGENAQRYANSFQKWSAGYVADYTKLANFAINNFGDQLSTNSSFRLSIDHSFTETSASEPGRTRQPDGSIGTYISTTVLNDKGSLKIALGHELVHVRDYDSGYAKRLIAAARSNRWNSDDVNNILEYRAYSWSAPIAKELGHPQSFFQNSTLEGLRSLLPQNFKDR